MSESVTHTHQHTPSCYHSNQSLKKKNSICENVHFSWAVETTSAFWSVNRLSRRFVPLLQLLQLCHLHRHTPRGTLWPTLLFSRCAVKQHLRWQEIEVVLELLCFSSTAPQLMNLQLGDMSPLEHWHVFACMWWIILHFFYRANVENELHMSQSGPSLSTNTGLKDTKEAKLNPLRCWERPLKRQALTLANWHLWGEFQHCWQNTTSDTVICWTGNCEDIQRTHGHISWPPLNHFLPTQRIIVVYSQTVFYSSQTESLKIAC